MAPERYRVDEAEEIARILFEPSMLEGADRISRNAFFLERLKSGNWEDYLSVWRTLYRVPTRENAGRIKPRKPLDRLYGYATLDVGTVQSAGEGLQVDAQVYRTDRDPKAYHVGIYYTLNDEPVKGECDDVDFMELTMILANEAKFFKFT